MNECEQKRCINLREADVPPHGIAFPLGALDALRELSVRW
jgi:hypothetical protein